MDTTVLIDAIVRQTTVLIAQLATAAGGRAPLGNTANQIFIALVRELKNQGLGNKVIADMFGLALRTYHSRVRRLAESETFHGRSLWEATLEYLNERGTVSQTEVLQRFRGDDEGSLRGVLGDLVESGMVFRTGRGATALYRAAKPEEYLAHRDEDGEAVASLVWVAVGRFGPATVDVLAQHAPFDRVVLDEALGMLVSDGRVARKDGPLGPEYFTDLCVIPLDAPSGWEAALFDHYQAVVTALCTKLRAAATVASARDRVGGSTFALTVWEGHPYYEEVASQLARMRADAIALREKVASYNRTHTAPDEAVRVISYMGQTMLEHEPEGELS